MWSITFSGGLGASLTHEYILGSVFSLLAQIVGDVEHGDVA